MKKIFAQILSITMVLSLFYSVGFSRELNPEVLKDQEAYTYILRKDGTVGTATVAEIDDMIFERNQAIIAGDKAKEESVQQAMYDAGVYPSTDEELSAFSDGKDIPGPSKGMTSVSYDTLQFTISGYDGNLYEIKRIVTHPTTSSNLFHSASVNNRTVSSSVASGVYKLLKVLGTAATSAAYVKANSFITAFDALSGAISGFSSTTTVYGITASYACAALEQVSFYQYLHGSTWTPFGSSSYIQTGFSSTIFSVSYSGGSQGLNMAVSQQQDTLYSPYSLNGGHTGYVTADILDRFLQTYFFDKKSQVVSAGFYHDANGTNYSIKTLWMLCPTTLTDIY